MAQTEKKNEMLNWKQKLDQGLPLTPLQEAQADADYNYQYRLRESEDRAKFEARKQGRFQSEDVEETEEEKNNGGKR